MGRQQAIEQIQRSDPRIERLIRDFERLRGHAHELGWSLRGTGGLWVTLGRAHADLS